MLLPLPIPGNPLAMRIIYITSILLGFSLLLNGCGDNEEVLPKKIPEKPTHIWADQVNTLNQAKDVADFANAQTQKQNEKFNEIGAGNTSAE